MKKLKKVSRNHPYICDTCARLLGGIWPKGPGIICENTFKYRDMFRKCIQNNTAMTICNFSPFFCKRFNKICSSHTCYEGYNIARKRLA